MSGQFDDADDDDVADMFEALFEATEEAPNGVLVFDYDVLPHPRISAHLTVKKKKRKRERGVARMFFFFALRLHRLFHRQATPAEQAKIIATFDQSNPRPLTDLVAYSSLATALGEYVFGLFSFFF